MDPAPKKAPASGRLAEGHRIYAIGDIHGRRDLLEALHVKILADAARADAPAKTIVYLGDYVDRGPDSRGVVDLLANGPVAGFNDGPLPGFDDGPLPGFKSVHLKGNHEALLLDFLDRGARLDGWLLNGAAATLKSYGVEAPGLGADSDTVATTQNALSAALPDAHLAFLRSLRPSFAAGGYFFAHAGVRPGVSLRRQRAEDLLWIRDAFLASDKSFGKLVVHGHTITREPHVAPNRIGIDTGAFESGVLTCLVAEGGARYFLHT